MFAGYIMNRYCRIDIVRWLPPLALLKKEKSDDKEMAVLITKNWKLYCITLNFSDMCHDTKNDHGRVCYFPLFCVSMCSSFHLFDYNIYVTLVWFKITFPTFEKKTSIHKYPAIHLISNMSESWIIFKHSASFLNVCVSIYYLCTWLLTGACWPLQRQAFTM